MGYFQPHGGPISRTLVGIVSPLERTAYEQISTVTANEQAFVMQEFDNPDAQQQRLAVELSDVLWLDSNYQQGFGGLWLNRNAQKNGTTDLVVIENGFLTDVTKKDAKLRAYWMARTMPDTQILVIDQPSHGLSDNYSSSQRRAMTRTGDMSEVGALQFEAIRRFSADNIPGPVHCAIKAESLGSRQSLDIINASDRTFPIDKLVAYEMPGTVGDRRLDIHTSYFFYEWLRSSYYKPDWLKPYGQAFTDFLQTYGNNNQMREADSFFSNDKLMAANNFWNSALGYGRGLIILEKVLEKASVVRVIGEASRIDKVTTATIQQTNLPFTLLVARYESHDGTGTLTRARLAAVLARHVLNAMDDDLNTETPIEFTMASLQSGRLPRLARS